MHDWDAVCDRYGPLVWGTVYRVLNDYGHALDCYQEVFLEVFERTRNRPVDDWPSLLRWLAVRRAIDRLRQRARIDAKVVGSPELLSSFAGTDGPVEAAQLNELMDRVCNELARLPKQQAEVFWMRSVERMSYAEIAQQLGITSNKVGVLVHRARARLRAELANFNPNRVAE